MLLFLRVRTNQRDYEKLYALLARYEASEFAPPELELAGVGFCIAGRPLTPAWDEDRFSDGSA